MVCVCVCVYACVCGMERLNMYNIYMLKMSEHLHNPPPNICPIITGAMSRLTNHSSITGVTDCAHQTGGLLIGSCYDVANGESSLNCELPSKPCAATSYPLHSERVKARYRLETKSKALCFPLLTSVSPPTSSL